MTTLVGISAAQTSPIDREALVARHAVTLERIDPHAAVMVGNGSLALSLDVTGLQGLRDAYAEHSPLLTEAQWAWHSFPNPEGYALDDAMKPIEVGGRSYDYPYIEDWAEADANPAIGWLRENPHRYSLGRLSFRLADGAEGEGRALSEEDVEDARQTLDLWSGTATSTFAIQGEPVVVSTRVHPDADVVLVEISSPLIEARQLGIDLAFPYVAKNLNPDPADWSSPDRHTTRLEEADGRILLERRLDADGYAASLVTEGATTPRLAEPHRVAIRPNAKTDTLRIALAFGPDAAALPTVEDFGEMVAASDAAWAAFWEEGGAVDLSGTDDPRAAELERRIVLSQYLTRVNGGTKLIPQEEGLYSNSWNGKFHHEMHWWHAAHFALWGREELLAPSLDWYRETLPMARERAAHYRREGAWWPKMTGDDARESPSTINPFIMWQQPHPIALAELLYRASPSRSVLEENAEVVFATADLLASFLTETEEGVLRLGPPVIPVQENWPAKTTYDPAFELAYWAYGLRTAQVWRERIGREPEPSWQAALDGLPPLPMAAGLYLPVGGEESFWTDVDKDACANGIGTTGGATMSGPAPDHDCHNRDHPSFLMAVGMIPGTDVDAEAMRRTMDATDRLWDFRQTWGWDFPMLAMTAARLGEPERALNYLMMDAANNQYGVTGMTPRYHLAETGWVRDADTYFPSNGSLLAAVALMAAGWDGSEGDAPGFPEDWVVRHEGLNPLP
ncbi:hypothetical protein [Parvularcula dongshanensis]|uniref:Glycoside hydrolase family 65 n=1 Tax=Parvularcula dongshanensis TaxID=1173995 RepID=A0A840I611_9PROT|nr:hypothetical protein [Parvularcula dongshanensis]MBB4659578.1 hypothetical protein [Parvularcula dongshanensis]